ncbi:MAG: F0F1 ATP synthase subunit epsilon [Candidatus Omnitrophota bacterium]|jgi:F-type H+-transporting ATPase subunit epsilon
MDKLFQIGIYSSDKIIYEGQAVSLVVPSESGYLGVLALHAPLVAKLRSGIITFKDSLGKVTSINVSQPGYIEVLHNKATILLN